MPVMLGSLAPGSFAGVEPDPDAVAAQRRHAVACITASMPRLSPRNAATSGATRWWCLARWCRNWPRPGLLAHAGLKNVLAAWRTPERFQSSPAWKAPGVALTDILIFGEIGLIGSRRGSDGVPVRLPAGIAMAPSGSASAVPIAEIIQTDKGTLALRGAMVPHQAFIAAASRGPSPLSKTRPGAAVDTFYPCRIDRSGHCHRHRPAARNGQRGRLPLRHERTGGHRPARS